MKKRVLSGLVLFTLFVITVVGCSKDEKVKIDQLVGKWSVAHDPNLSVDGSILYTFNEDNTCTINVYDVFSGSDTIIYRTYQIGNNQRLITLFSDGSQYTGQYHIRKLNNSEMKWENASPNDGNPQNMRLVRSVD